MKKTLKIKFQKQCIGCELCVFESQRQLQKVGFEGSLIRIMKNKLDQNKKLEFYIELDPRINKLDIDKISEICPKNVFEISQSDEEEHGSSLSF